MTYLFALLVALVIIFFLLWLTIYLKTPLGGSLSLLCAALTTILLFLALLQVVNSPM